LLLFAQRLRDLLIGKLAHRLPSEPTAALTLSEICCGHRGVGVRL